MIQLIPKCVVPCPVTASALADLRSSVRRLPSVVEAKPDMRTQCEIFYCHELLMLLDPLHKTSGTSIRGTFAPTNGSIIRFRLLRRSYSGSKVPDRSSSYSIQQKVVNCERPKSFQQSKPPAFGVPVAAIVSSTEMNA